MSNDQNQMTNKCQNPNDKLHTLSVNIYEQIFSFVMEGPYSLINLRLFRIVNVKYDR